MGFEESTISTSLPFSIWTFAKRAINTKRGNPPRPGSATGFSESLTSYIKYKHHYHKRCQNMAHNAVTRFS